MLHKMTGRAAARLAITALSAMASLLPVSRDVRAQANEATPMVGLPDTETSQWGALKAWLIDPTTRYRHAVLGDAIEAGGFVVERAGKRLVYRLPPDAVFEDRRVRLADLDGDSVPEAIIVKSYLQRGAAIAVYRILPDRIEPLAESEAIGTPNRWLNPVGIADFTGSGKPVIAAVITPHLAGSLRLYGLAGSTLSLTTQIDGYTNHIIGSRDLDLARVARVMPDEPPLIIIPTRERQTLAAISFRGGEPRVMRTWPLKARIEGLRIESGRKARVSTKAGEVIIDLRKRPD